MYVSLRKLSKDIKKVCENLTGSLPGKLPNLTLLIVAI